MFDVMCNVVQTGGQTPRTMPADARPGIMDALVIWSVHGLGTPNALRNVM
jgi:hypothetical protein